MLGCPFMSTTFAMIGITEIWPILLVVIVIAVMWKLLYHVVRKAVRDANRDDS